MADWKSEVMPVIGITIGDPAGIGPEVTLKAVADDDLGKICLPVVIGDAGYLSALARRLDIDPGFTVIGSGDPIPRQSELPIILDLGNIGTQVEMGREDASCGRAAAEFIEKAVELCLNGSIDAMTTAPINKKSLSLAGCQFPGHTEYLAHLSETTDYAMAFISPRLRVALLTTHVSLASVPGYVTRDSLVRLIRLVDRELRRYGIERPRIALAALNPHGGEGALFGTEERDRMQPAVELCRRDVGIDVTGPHSGDTVFVRAARGEFDIVISCYHDQGLIPIKCFSFGEAVNVTLGLPFIRTSVDHGTAFDIAGKGVADHSSMIVAVRLAADLHLKRIAG